MILKTLSSATPPKREDYCRQKKEALKMQTVQDWVEKYEKSLVKSFLSAAVRIGSKTRTETRQMLNTILNSNDPNRVSKALSQFGSGATYASGSAEISNGVGVAAYVGNNIHSGGIYGIVPVSNGGTSKSSSSSSRSNSSNSNASSRSTTPRNVYLKGSVQPVCYPGTQIKITALASVDISSITAKDSLTGKNISFSRNGSKWQATYNVPENAPKGNITFTLTSNLGDKDTVSTRVEHYASAITR